MSVPSHAEAPAGTRYALFVGVAPGLEGLLEEELRHLGVAGKLSSQPGGIGLWGGAETLWHIAHWSRIAELVRVRVGAFQAADFRALQAGLERLPWNAYLVAGCLPSIRVRTERSALYHTGAVEERVREWLVTHLGAASTTASEGAPTLHVRVARDQAQVSIEATGELFRRGYRTAIGAAPLRETLAAACLWAAAAHQQVALADPFCGSGTLLIEACARRAGLPATIRQDFPFTHWPTHDATAYHAWRASNLAAGNASGAALWAHGSDRDASALTAASANAERAQVGSVISWGVADAAAAVSALPRGAMVVANLPYGQRLAGGALFDTFARFGRALSRRPDVAAWVLNGHAEFASRSGLSWQMALRFRNRGLPVAWLQRA